MGRRTTNSFVFVPSTESNFALERRRVEAGITRSTKRDECANGRTSFVQRPSHRCLHRASCTPNNRDRSFSPALLCLPTNCAHILPGIGQVMTEADDFPTRVITVLGSCPRELVPKVSGIRYVTRRVKNANDQP